MSVTALTNPRANSSSVSKEHAITHFFAVLAGVDDLRELSQLLVSGIGALVGMDAVVLGIMSEGGGGWVQRWHGGSATELQEITGGETEVRAAVSRLAEQLRLPFVKILPAVHQGNAVGYIALARQGSGPLSREAEYLISSVQSLTALLLANYRAAMLLRHSQEWLRVTLASIGDAVMTCDANGDLTYLNPVAEALTGWSTEEVVGTPIQQVFRIVNEETGKPARDIVQQVLRDGRTAALANHTALVARGGREIPIEDSAAPIRDANGTITGVVLVFHDVTERRRAEEALRASEQQVRHKLDSILSPEGEIGKLELGDIIDAPALQAMMEEFHKLARVPLAIIDIEGKVLVGVGWQDVCTKFHRVNKESCKHCIESDVELSAGVPSGQYRLYHCKNHMWDVATPITVGGKHLGNVFTGQFFFEGEKPDVETFRAQARRFGFDEAEYFAALDRVPRLSREALAAAMAYFMKLADMISKLSYSNIKLARSLAQREALTESLRSNEARLRLALDAAKSGTWEWDLKTNKSMWSDEVWALYGLAPHSCEPCIAAWLDIVYLPDREPARKMIAEAAQKGVELNVEFRVIEDSGSSRWLLVRGRPICDEDGRPVRYVGIVMDINERKRTEAALLQSEKLASVGRMATTIAHEINNPLAAVMNTLFLARTREELSQVRQDLDVADAELQRVAQITRQALGFYRESAAPAPVFVRGILDSTVDLLASKIRAKSASVRIDCDHDAEVTANAGELRQVIANLLSNSLDAIAAGGNLKLRASTLSVRNGGHYVRITVADDGKGIDRVLLPRIFEPFFTTKDSVGTGLGLWVSKQIVEKYAGSIRVRSATSGRHRGTACSVLLPGKSARPQACAKAAGA